MRVLWFSLISVLLSTNVRAEVVFINGMGAAHCRDANRWSNDNNFRPYFEEWVDGYTTALVIENNFDFKPGDAEEIVENVFMECRSSADDTMLVDIIKPLALGYPTRR